MKEEIIRHFHIDGKMDEIFEYNCVAMRENVLQHLLF